MVLSDGFGEGIFVYATVSAHGCWKTSKKADLGSRRLSFWLGPQAQGLAAALALDAGLDYAMAGSALPFLKRRRRRTTRGRPRPASTREVGSGVALGGGFSPEPTGFP